MAQAIPKNLWLQAEDDAASMAYMEYFVERWLRQGAIPFVTRAQDYEDTDVGAELERAEALQSFGWFQSPRSSVSH